MSEINFLHPGFKAEVSCSCVAEDDYQPSNLISPNNQERERGFMAFNVVKPPVELTFTLNYSINLSRIKLWTVIGSLRSTGFEVYTPSDSGYILAGKCSNVQVNAIEFNHGDNSLPSGSNYLQSRFFPKNIVRKSLENTNKVRLVITSTGRCAVVLARIEIWGKPSSSLDTKTQDECWKLWSAACSSGINERKRKRPETETPKESQISDNIPEEYLDSITCELMLFPMRLPSGKVVDQPTVEKHSNIEEKWGRPPSDPFTGKAYTAKSKPILDVNLKSRIDKFLLENSNHQDFLSIPRTLGRKHNKKEACHEQNISYNSPQSSAQTLKPNGKFSSNLSSMPLNEAMEAALNAIRQQSTIYASNIKEKSKCFSCDSNTQLFKITTCDHIVCRTCLNGVRNSQVCLCSKVFSNANVQRIFE